MNDVAAAYGEVQDRLVRVVQDASDEQRARPVIACPGWSVAETFSHLVATFCEATTGGARELADLDFFGDLEATWARVASMSARQVHARADQGVDQLVHEWRDAFAVAGPMLRGERAFPAPTPAFAQALLINDLVVHEGDLRAALDLPPAPDSTASALALGNYAFLAAMRVGSAGLPAVALDDGASITIVGGGAPAATLRAPRHDLVRVLAARRSPDQIRALDWEGDPGPYVDLLPAYGVVHPQAADALAP